LCTEEANMSQRLCLWIAIFGLVVIHSTDSSDSNNVHDKPLKSVYHDYCVIGAGPSGLQMGYYLERAGRDYVIFEKSNTPGNFYTTYPRHRQLISINKRNTGSTNKEFNWRHDWNSLLSDDESLEMRHYSKKMFPPADDLVQYLKDYQSKLGIKVQFNTTISDIVKLSDPKAQDHVFAMKDQNGQTYLCQTLLVATGAATPIVPEFPGSELTIGYEDVPIDGESFEGQSVLILGRGNAAFETADAIYGNTNYIHMVARSRVRLSWSTHYVGDLRGINNGLLDTYQLKSLDGLAELDVRGMNLTRNADGRISITPAQKGIYSDLEVGDNYPFRDDFDAVIRCLGFKFDDSIFSRSPAASAHATKSSGSSHPGSMSGKKKKYPNVTPDYQAANVSGLYFIGVIGHGVDWRESAGGFIHGFRYTARMVHRVLEKRNHGISWPHQTYPITEIVPTMTKRINEASGTYQMFYVLGDVYAISPDGESFQVYEEFPVKLIHKFAEMTGCNFTRMIAQVMEYGPNFSGPGADVFRSGRAVGDSDVAHESNFLHPVFYYYSELPTTSANTTKNKHEKMPEADQVHHIVEDFTTFWDGEFTHIGPLRRFVDHVLNLDLRRMSAEDCFEWIMSHGYSTNEKMPSQCRSYASTPGAAFNLASSESGDGAQVDPWTMRAPLAPLFNVESLL